MIILQKHIPAYLIMETTDYGRPMKPFFIEMENFLAWTDILGRQILGHLGYFRLNYFGTVSPLSIFSIIQPLYLQNTKPLISTSQIFI